MNIDGLTMNDKPYLMSLVKTPADDSKTAAAEDHESQLRQNPAVLRPKMLRFLHLSLLSVLLLPMRMFPPSMK